MSDFHSQVSILRDQMVDALCENPKQLAYVLMQLGDRLPGTWSMDELLDHLRGETRAENLPQVAACFRQIADALMEAHQ